MPALWDTPLRPIARKSVPSDWSFKNVPNDWAGLRLPAIFDRWAGCSAVAAKTFLHFGYNELYVSKARARVTRF